MLLSNHWRSYVNFSVRSFVVDDHNGRLFPFVDKLAWASIDLSNSTRLKDLVFVCTLIHTGSQQHSRQSHTTTETFNGSRLLSLRCFTVRASIAQTQPILYTQLEKLSTRSGWRSTIFSPNFVKHTRSIQRSCTTCHLQWTERGREGLWRVCCRNSQREG